MAVLTGMSRNTATFTPVTGSYSNGNLTSATVATYTITASTACIWSYELGTNVTCNIANNASATSITFTLNQGTTDRTRTTNVAATNDGFGAWTITLQTVGTGGGVGVTVTA